VGSHSGSRFKWADTWGLWGNLYLKSSTEWITSKETESSCASIRNSRNASPRDFLFLVKQWVILTCYSRYIFLMSLESLNSQV
jgi:hypothetical protein